MNPAGPVRKDGCEGRRHGLAGNALPFGYGRCSFPSGRQGADGRGPISRLRLSGPRMMAIPPIFGRRRPVVHRCCAQWSRLRVWPGSTGRRSGGARHRKRDGPVRVCSKCSASGPQGGLSGPNPTTAARRSLYTPPVLPAPSRPGCLMALIADAGEVGNLDHKIVRATLSAHRERGGGARACHGRSSARSTRTSSCSAHAEPGALIISSR